MYCGPGTDNRFLANTEDIVIETSAFENTHGSFRYVCRLIYYNRRIAWPGCHHPLTASKGRAHDGDTASGHDHVNFAMRHQRRSGIYRWIEHRRHHVIRPASSDARKPLDWPSTSSTIQVNMP